MDRGSSNLNGLTVIMTLTVFWSGVVLGSTVAESLHSRFWAGVLSIGSWVASAWCASFVFAAKETIGRIGDRIFGAPFRSASHPRVSAGGLSLVGAFLTGIFFVDGLLSIGIILSESRGSLPRVLAALSLIPAWLLASWAMGALDYRVRVWFHRYKDRDPK
jgi:hypothetical protein